MPTGSVTLLEAAKSGDDMLKAGVVETLIQESPILEMLPMTSIQGNALRSQLEVSLPTPEYREVNATYSRSWGSDREVFWGTVILGGEVFVDNYLVHVRGNVSSVKAKQYRKYAKAMSRQFDKTFFDGDGTANDFKGLKTLISEGFGQLTTQSGTFASDGFDRMDIAHDLLRSQSSADVMLLNRTVRRLITKQALDPATNNFPLIDVGDDKFGRQIMQWNGIPMRIIGDDATGSAILPMTEAENSGSASSIYFVAYGEEENLTGLMGAGGHFEVMDFGETEAAPGHLGRVEVYPGIAIFNPYSVVRMAGVKA